MKKVAMVLFLAASALTYADTPSKLPQSPIIEERGLDTMAAPGDFNFQKAFWKMVLTLIALIFFLILTFWSLKKMKGAKQLQKNTNQAIKIVEKRALSSKTLLYLVEVDDKKFVLSESQYEVRSLKALPEDMAHQSSK